MIICLKKTKLKYNLKERKHDVFYSLVKFRKYDLRQISDKPSICSLYGLDVKSLIYLKLFKEDKM